MGRMFKVNIKKYSNLELLAVRQRSLTPSQCYSLSSHRFALMLLKNKKRNPFKSVLNKDTALDYSSLLQLVTEKNMTFGTLTLIYPFIFATHN